MSHPTKPPTTTSQDHIPRRKHRTEITTECFLHSRLLSSRKKREISHTHIAPKYRAAATEAAFMPDGRVFFSLSKRRSPLFFLSQFADNNNRLPPQVHSSVFHIHALLGTIQALAERNGVFRKLLPRRVHTFCPAGTLQWKLPALLHDVHIEGGPLRIFQSAKMYLSGPPRPSSYA